MGQAEWVTFIPDTQTKIIGKVQRGTWEPARAEAVAARLGLGPIAKTPDALQFDPMLVATWSLAMTVAWIAWRDPERVRNCWTEFRTECLRWNAYEERVSVDGGPEWRTRIGWDLLQLEPMTLMKLCLSEAISETADHSQVVSVRSAREALWQVLSEGGITASAIKHATGRPLEIPAFEWPHISLTGSNNLEDQLRFTGVDQVEYSRLTFLRTEVLQVWQDDRGLSQAADAAPTSTDEPSSDGYDDPAKGRRKRSPDQERVRPFLDNLYPEGVPDKTVATDGQIYRLVATEMDKAAKEDHRLRGAPSRETILRAAGRM